VPPRAIVVVDPQPDFFEDGPLPIAGRERDRAANPRLSQRARDSFDVGSSPRTGTSVLRTLECDAELRDDLAGALCAESPGAQVHEALVNVRWDAVIHKGGT